MWAWKGDYANLGAGAELGLYKKSPIGLYNNYHYYTASQLNVPMDIRVRKNGKEIACWNSSMSNLASEKTQWWVNVFTPQYQNNDYQDLEVNINIYCVYDEYLYKSIKESYKTNESDFKMSFYNKTISITY